MSKMSTEIRDKLAEIFLIVLDLPDETDVTSLRRISCEKWDSLAAVSLVAAIEAELGVMLTATQQERCVSFEAVSLLINEIKP